MSPPSYKVLVLSTGNAARSIIAEYLLRYRSAGRFEAHSAGSRPTGMVNPWAHWVLKELFGIDAADARSKSWEEFKAQPFDLVITVGDPSRESCPLFPGHEISAHFGVANPTALLGDDDEKKALFLAVATSIAARVELLCALPASQLELMRAKTRLVSDRP